MRRHPAFDPPEYTAWTPLPDVMQEYRDCIEKDPERIGITEIRYIEGLYQMWEDIVAANPNVFIDNCASGGRRIDLESIKLSDLGRAKKITLTSEDPTIVGVPESRPRGESVIPAGSDPAVTANV